jgi:hypothetical protein
VISASSAVSVAGNHAANSYAIWGDGVGASAPSQINLTGAVTITTPSTASGSFGLFASGGGSIAAPDLTSITTGGNSSFGVIASGSSSSLSVPSSITLGGGSILTTGLDANGVVSVSGAQVTLNGGSVKTSGDGSPGVVADLSKLSATGTTTGPGSLDPVRRLA